MPKGFGAIATNSRPSYKHKGGTFLRTAGECFPQGFTGRALRIGALTPPSGSLPFGQLLPVLGLRVQHPHLLGTGAGPAAPPVPKLRARNDRPSPHPRFATAFAADQSLQVEEQSSRRGAVPVANFFTRSCPHVSEAFSSEAKPTGKCPGKELESFADGQATRLLSQCATVFKPATTRSLVAESAHH